MTYEQYQRTISLPLHPGLTDDEVLDVIAAVADICEAYRTAKRSSDAKLSGRGNDGCGGRTAVVPGCFRAGETSMIPRKGGGLDGAACQTRF